MALSVDDADILTVCCYKLCFILDFLSQQSREPIELSLNGQQGMFYLVKDIVETIKTLTEGERER